MSHEAVIKSAHLSAQATPGHRCNKQESNASSFPEKAHHAEQLPKPTNAPSEQFNKPSISAEFAEVLAAQALCSEQAPPQQPHCPQKSNERTSGQHSKRTVIVPKRRAMIIGAAQQACNSRRGNQGRVSNLWRSRACKTGTASRRASYQRGWQ